MQVWPFIKSESDTISEEQLITIFYYCVYAVSFEIHVFYFFLKNNIFLYIEQIFVLHIVYMILEIDIHRYTGKDASLLSLKKKPNKGMIF